MRLCLVAILCLLGSVAQAADRREALLLSSCTRESGEYTGSYRGRILLHKAYLATMGDEVAAIRTSIEHQLRYLWGHYRNDADAHAKVQLALSAETPELKIVSRKDVPYGRDLLLPYPEKQARLQLEDAYTIAAVKRGSTMKGDPALLIEFELSWKAAICGRAIDPPASVRVPLPPDPWLAYWYVPRRLHRPLRYHQDRAVTNPCADDDFADLPHPFYYWYDWLPTRHGPDDSGRSFDCRKLLHAGDHYDFFDVKLSRAGAPTQDFSKLRAQLASGPLTATILVGVTDHTVTDPQLATWRTLLGDASDGELPVRASSALVAWARGKQMESGTRSFLKVLEELSSVMRIARHKSTLDDGYLLVEVNGTLVKSGRPIRVRVYLGLTDIFGPVPPKHWRLLRRALTEDQIVAYWGHSGIGENFRLAQIEKNLAVPHEQMAKELRASPLRLVAFISCYSYMYFGQDLLAAGAELKDGAYFVFTGVEAAKHEAGPLAVLELVDDVLRPGNAEGRVSKLTRLGDDEFWLVKEVAGKK